MIPIKVALVGCEGTTEIHLEVSASELELLNHIAKLSVDQSQMECEPRMDIFLQDGGDDRC